MSRTHSLPSPSSLERTAKKHGYKQGCDAVHTKELKGEQKRTLHAGGDAQTALKATHQHGAAGASHDSKARHSGDDSHSLKRKRSSDCASGGGDIQPRKPEDKATGFYLDDGPAKKRSKTAVVGDTPAKAHFESSASIDHSSRKIHKEHRFGNSTHDSKSDTMPHGHKLTKESNKEQPKGMPHKPGKSSSKGGQRDDLLGSGDEDAGLRVNAAFARRYEERKKREELSRLAEQYGSGSDSESASTSDEDGALVTPETDAQILRTLAVIRAREPQIYDAGVRHFDEAAIEAAAERRPQKQLISKPVTLKDVQREKLLGGAQSEESGDERPVNTHEEEQRQILADFKKAAAHIDEGDLVPVKREREDGANAEYRRALLDALTREKVPERLPEWFSASAPDETERFLAEYVLNRGWVDSKKEARPLSEDSADEEHLEAADAFEETYNFRFEQPGGCAIASHPRSQPGSLRRPEDATLARKEQRARRRERQREEETRIRNEVARLKALKADEIAARLGRIAAVGGADPGAFDLDSDFDPAEHDRRMAAAFGDEYYRASEDSAALRLDRDLEDELGDANAVDEADLQHARAVLAEAQDELVRERQAAESQRLSADQSDAAPAQSGDSADAGEFTGGESDRPAKSRRRDAGKIAADQSDRAALPTAQDSRRAARRKVAALLGKRQRPEDADVARLLDEYARLDARAPSSRFAYAPVAPLSFGLRPREIFEAPDALLNAHAGLKRLAPYRPADVVARDAARLASRARVCKFRDAFYQTDKRLLERKRAPKAE